MRKDEKVILITKAIIKHAKDLDRDYLINKLDACFELAKPEVILGEEEGKIYNKLVEDYKKQGRII